MRRTGLFRGMLRGAVAGAILAAGSLTAFAAASIRLPDGRMLSVWESRTAVRSLDGSGRTSTLAYSISGPAGVFQGAIPGTEDAARDVSPRLAIDPASGHAIAVWTRFDGVYEKIAYARLEGSSWLDLHFLTFGGGDDAEPRVVVARDGAFLFWISQGDRHVYVPVEISAGRLLGGPRELRLGSHGPSFTTQGGMDTPIILKTHDGGGRNSQLPWTPSGDLTVSGGVDAPVVIDHHKKASLWGAGGSPDCRNAVVVLPNPTETLLRVFSFTNGVMREIGRVHLPESIPDGLADQTAAAYLNAYCN